MKFAYYNEIDLYCVEWLQNLIKAGHIPEGEVDTRSIKDVCGDDLKEFGPCHFFAGIGGWAYAARLAGISDDEPIWTGSCPCQPLSSAGQRKGHADERHLWPAFHALIAERRPATVFGEQVASKDGREWLAGVRADLEDLGYAVGAADLCAACKKAKHNRPRLFWVGYTTSLFCNGLSDYSSSRRQRISEWESGRNDSLEAWSSGYRNMDEPSIPVLAYAVPGLLGATTAYGNAIVPQVAAEFILASKETMCLTPSKKN